MKKKKKKIFGVQLIFMISQNGGLSRCLFYFLLKFDIIFRSRIGLVKKYNNLQNFEILIFFKFIVQTEKKNI